MAAELKPRPVQLSGPEPWKLIVDGHDISNNVTTVHVTIGHDPAGHAIAVVELKPISIDVDGGLMVALGTATREALIALGWIPPEPLREPAPAGE